MRKVAEYTYQVQPLDVDFSDRIRLTQLLGYFLHTASRNAMENGFGMEALHEQGKTWVASRIALEIGRYPKAYETFRIETWIESFDRVFTTRNFRMTGADGSLIGAGTSVWCMMDLHARKALDLRGTDYTAFTTGIPSLIEKPRRLPPIQGASVSRHRVKYSDLDLNKHTNSMKYIEWMIDLFPLDLFQARNITRLDINYLNEALFGDVMEIYRQQSDEQSCLFEMRRGETIICRAGMQFDGSYRLTADK